MLFLIRSDIFYFREVNNDILTYWQKCRDNDYMYKHCIVLISLRNTSVSWELFWVRLSEVTLSSGRREYVTRCGKKFKYVLVAFTIYISSGSRS